MLTRCSADKTPAFVPDLVIFCIVVFYSVILIHAIDAAFLSLMVFVHHCVHI